MKNTIAFFDVDGTVINSSTGYYAAIQLMKKGHFNLLNVLDAGFQSILHLFSKADHDEIYKSTIKLLDGLTKAELVEICMDAFKDHVMKNIYIGTSQLIENHKKKGDKVVFISAGPHGIIEIMGQFFDIDDVIITKLVYDENGVLTHELNKDALICYGENKVTLAEEYISGNGLSLKDCYFYSDSASDLPLLEAVGYPNLVNPDLELTIKAFLNNWKVYKFKDKYTQINIDRHLKNIDLEKIVKLY